MTQAIFSQASDAIYKAASVVVETGSAGVQWFGRAVVYLKDVSIEVAARVIDFAGHYFSALQGVVAQNPQAFAAIGIVAGIGVAAYAISKLCSQPAKPVKI